MIMAVGLQTKAGLRPMLSGRHARDHRDRYATANQPVFIIERLNPVAVLQGLLDQLQALIEAVAPIVQILRLLLKRNEAIGRAYDIAPAELNWVYLQSAGNLVY